mmetsp:Transcript_27338/g.64254  ORF Transcript_27338/g.64254 Transcript_27338/m.64254 type:complete len:562 (-) Transcript_27338:218-1903(-)
MKQWLWAGLATAIIGTPAQDCFEDSVLEAGADAEALRLLQGRAARRSFAVEFADSALATASADFDSTGLQQIGSRSTSTCGYALALLILASFAGICVEWLARGQLHRTLISLLLIAECLTSATYTVVVPLSYDLATHLGQGSAFSGLMVSAPFAVYLAGALRARWVMMSWNQAKICTYIVGAYAIYVLSTALCAAVVHPPAFLFLSGNATLRASLLLVLRMSYGLVDSVGDVMQMMVVKVSPQEELRELMVSIFASNALGFGLGPLLSGAIGEVVQVSDLELRACIPLIVLALLWTALLLAIRSNLPLELSEAETGLGRQDVDGVDDADPDDSICESGDLALSRRIIFWAGLIYALICAALTSSLEAQTALVLERQLHFSAQSIGLLLGSAFCATAPLTVMLSWLPTEIERPWPICVALPPMLATVFLFKGTCVFLGLGELRHWAMLAADVVLFSVALCANGIVDATALQHAGGTRLYCRENYVIAAATLRAAGSFLGPPAVRILAFSGEDAGAAMQLVLVLLAIVSVAMIKSLGAWLHDTEADLLAAQCRLKDKVVSHRE